MLDSLDQPHPNNFNSKFILRANSDNSLINIVIVESFDGLDYSFEVDEIFCGFYFVYFCYYQLDVYVVFVASLDELEVGLF
jgi:hypothetical protein